MTLSNLTSDEQTLLDTVPLDGTIGGKALRNKLGWEKDRYRGALTSLVEKGRLRVGRGHGGSVERVIGENASTLLEVIPINGTRVTNASVRRNLGWDRDTYFNVRDELIDQGLVDTHRGQGGMVYRVISEAETRAEVDDALDDEQPAVEQHNQIIRESDLYEPIAKVLCSDWAKDIRLHTFAVEIIAHQGSAKTGGRWSRPDVAVLSLRRFPLTGAVVFDVYTFEVKLAGQWDVTAIYETAAHARRATYAYAFLHHVGELSPEDPTLAACVQEAKRLGVGLITSPNVDDYATWVYHVEPTRHAPSPEMLEKFVAQQFSRERVDEVREWWAQISAR